MHSTTRFRSTVFKSLEEFTRTDVKPQVEVDDGKDSDDEYGNFIYTNIQVVEVKDMPIPPPRPPQPPRRRVQVPIKRVKVPLQDPLAIIPVKRPVQIQRPAILSIGPLPPGTSDSKPKISPNRRRGNGKEPKGRPIPPGVKMYELDPNLYPEAANARASYENRIKRKQEKEKIVRDLANLRQRHKELEDENKLLKIQLSNAGSHANGNDWLCFFRDALIKPGLDLKYAIIFERNHITYEMLDQLTEANLRDMGVRPFGDIVSILKHAKLLVDHDAREAREAGLVVKPGPPIPLPIPKVNPSKAQESGSKTSGSAIYGVDMCEEEELQEEEEEDEPRMITIRSLADLM